MQRPPTNLTFRSSTDLASPASKGFGAFGSFGGSGVTRPAVSPPPAGGGNPMLRVGTTGGPMGSGYTQPAPKFNHATGKYDLQPPKWIGPGNEPVGGRQAHDQWLRAVANPNGAWDDYQGRKTINATRMPGGSRGVPGNGAPGDAPYGLSAAEDAVTGGAKWGRAMLDLGMDDATDAIVKYGLKGIGGLSGYDGEGAHQLQMALSGALGEAAQREAYDSYIKSPGQEYLQDEGELAILRNASATGGLQGSNVLRELQRHGIGTAAQDFANSYERLNNPADRGYGAGRDILGAYTGMGSQLGDMRLTGGLSNANMAFQGGLAKGAMRNRVGELLSGNIGSTSSALAQLINQGGADVAQMLGLTSGNLANLLSGLGGQNAQSLQALAALLANIATGSGSQVAGLPGLPGVDHDPGIGESLGSLISGIGAAYGSSDVRLKTNIQPIGTYRGVNLYSWDWNEAGQAIAGGQPTVGVIAQEVPWATEVGEDGYLRVDYTRVF